ncbi:type-F conjugative transfer system pilin assembly protein TrbC [Sphingomonas sp. BIUV-7]|uniref:Type-F conjugative transfer system pilin assembly protein TrbC n=1 Tax=Sphingomonas natans TaxID=3063330 RepID=A0ABT8YAV2_9SPHN|nr:type-F conjugative transfer system pilin assembly protein TrbC [Sphingomonas sp. BIUV-7]MDO6415446.1 type-F conjugative transfer system pilin assembly protein TrbC [Sphingomonas sp. BIUV-7]
MRAPLSVAVLGGVLLAHHSTAQIPPGGAGASIARQGDAALDRLRGAIVKAKKRDARPGPLPQLSPQGLAQATRALQHRMRSQAMETRGRAALDAGRLDLARQREAMSKRLGQALGLDAPDVTTLARATMPPTKTLWVPVLFVSSSMPTTTLRTYAAQVAKAKGVMAFRGMPGGLAKVAPMAKLSAEILRVDPGCEGPACTMRDVQVIVDPIVFRQHGVARVPALAMVPGDPTQAYCERDEESPRGAHVVYGDAALTGLLDEIARLGGREEVRDAQARLVSR